MCTKNENNQKHEEKLSTLIQSLDRIGGGVFGVIGFVTLAVAVTEAIATRMEGESKVFTQPAFLTVAAVGSFFIVLAFRRLGDFLIRKPVTLFADGLWTAFRTTIGKGPMDVPKGICIIATAWTWYGLLHFEDWFFHSPQVWMSWYWLMVIPYIVTGIFIAPGLFRKSRVSWFIAFLSAIPFVILRILWFAIPSIRDGVFGIPQFPYSGWEIGTGVVEIILFTTATIILWRHRMLYLDPVEQTTKVIAHPRTKRVALLFGAFLLHPALLIVTALLLGDKIPYGTRTDIALRTRFKDGRIGYSASRQDSDGYAKAAIIGAAKWYPRDERERFRSAVFETLDVALSRGKVEDAQFMFDQGYDTLNPSRSLAAGDLYSSCVANDESYQFLDVLLKKGYDPIAIGPISHPILYAASKGNLRAMLWFEQQGVPLKTRNRAGWDAFDYAVRRTQFRVANFLIKERDFNILRRDSRGNTLIHKNVANFYWKPAILNYLLKHKVPINALNDDGLTALDLAMRDKQADERNVALLRSKGAKTAKELGHLKPTKEGKPE